MTAPTTYWIGSTFVAEWALTDAAGNPVTDATVSATVALPSGATAGMSVEHQGGSNVYTASYQAVAAGRHGWRLQASGASQGVVEGEFVVTRSVTGAAPITTDPTTDLGMIRTLIADVDEAYPLLTDAQLQALLTLEGGNVRFAAAAAIGIIATSETLIAKKISTQNLSVDGPAVARELREQAAVLRAQGAVVADAETADAVLPLFSFPAAVSWGDSYL